MFQRRRNEEEAAKQKEIEELQAKLAEMRALSDKAKKGEKVVSMLNSICP